MAERLFICKRGGRILRRRSAYCSYQKRAINSWIGASKLLFVNQQVFLDCLLQLFVDELFGFRSAHLLFIHLEQQFMLRFVAVKYFLALLFVALVLARDNSEVSLCSAVLVYGAVLIIQVNDFTVAGLLV